MSAAKHTPGPWWVEHDRTVTAPTPDSSDAPTARITLCEVWSGGCGIAQADANQRLIAAAPELLEALQIANEALCDLPLMDTRTVAIRAAIAKATGSQS